jgi:GNAT superfamily N-acetyltransferase
MSIREATPADLDVVAALRLEFLAEHRGVDPMTFTTEFRATTSEFLRRHSESGTSRSWLAERDGDAVGVVTMLVLDLAPRPEDVSGLEGYIINMYVAPRHRRQGLGRELLTACRGEADQSGLRRLLLYATDDGAPLYERAGFRHNERWMELPLWPRQASGGSA